MSYSRLDEFVATKKAHFRRERERLEGQLKELDSLERSPSSVVAGGAGDAVGGQVGRALRGQPAAALGDTPFAEKLSDILRTNQADLFDESLGDMGPLAGQIYTKLMSLTSMDPNRALFDIAQRGAEEMKRRFDVGKAFSTDLLTSAIALRDQVVVMVPSQGTWFSDEADGFKKNVVEATKRMDGVDAALAAVTEKLESSVLPLQGGVDDVKTALLRVREELVPLNASLRPEAGADHPQAAELVATAQLMPLRDGMLNLLDKTDKEAASVAQQKSGLASFLSDANTRTRGASLTGELAKLFRQFTQQASAVRAQLSHAAGSGGVAEVFTREEEWITTVEVMLAVLERPLLQLGTTSEDGGGSFDTATGNIKAAFELMASDIGGVGDFDFSTLDGAVRELAQMASSSLGSSGFTVPDVDAVLATITTQVSGLHANFGLLESLIDSSGFLGGLVPKLDQVTSFIDSLKGGQFDSSAEFLTSGVLFDDGVATTSVRSIDSRGRFAEELRTLSGDTDQDVTELSQERVERVHRVIETDERRQRRLALTYEDAIEDAKEEVRFEQVKLDELERELGRVEPELRN